MRIETIAAVLLATGITASAQAQDQPRRPKAAISMANDLAGRTIDGVHYKQVQGLMSAANEKRDAAFAAMFAPDAKRSFREFGSPGSKPFDAAFLRLATQSCFGPYSYDETAEWAQVIWVCRTDAASPLASMLSFHYCPELVVTFWFDGDRIKGVDAFETPPVPGFRYLPMDAYAQLKAGARL